MSMSDAARLPRWLLSALQICLSLALMLWLARGLDWGELTAAWKQIDPRWVALSVTFYYLSVAISCYKWRLTLASEGLSAPFGRLLRWYLIGSFASNFLPTEIGGDLGRGIYAARSLGSAGGVARSIFLERLTGLVALLAIALTSAGLLFNLWWLIGLIIAASCGAGLGARRIDQALLLRGGRIANTYQKIRAALITSLGSPGRMAQLLIASLILQLLSCFGVWLNMRAVHVDLDLGRTIQVASLASAAGSLPISMNGWGVRESIYTSLLNGALLAQILAGALFGRLLALLLSMSGALALAFEPAAKPVTEGSP